VNATKNPVSGLRKLKQIRSALLMRVSSLDSKQCPNPDDHLDIGRLIEKVVAMEEENAGMPKP